MNNRMQLAAALQARGNPQGGQMTQQGYAPRPGVPTRQGMPQMTGNSYGPTLPAQAAPQAYAAAPQIGMRPTPRNMR